MDDMSRAVRAPISRDEASSADDAAAPDWERQAQVTLGRRIRAARLARGLSQTALAHAVGVTFQQVQKYETGRNRVTATTLVRIAQILDLDPSALLRGLLPPVPGQGAHAMGVPIPEGTPEAEVWIEAALVFEAYCAIPSPRLRAMARKVVQALGDREAAMVVAPREGDAAEVELVICARVPAGR